MASETYKAMEFGVVRRIQSILTRLGGCEKDLQSIVSIHNAHYCHLARETFNLNACCGDSCDNILLVPIQCPHDIEYPNERPDAWQKGPTDARVLPKFLDFRTQHPTMRWRTVQSFVKSL